ncbi:MAG TPA: pitrilysin family protein [Candidatus Eisenbacteria bacterium]|jgi:zinc protease
MKALRPGRAALLLAACALPATLATLAAPAAGGVPPYRVPAPVAKTLDNGLKVLVFSDPRLPVVEVQIRIPAGVAAEPPGQNGVAGMTARLLSRGTTSRDAAAFDRDLGQLGTTLSAFAGREYAIASSAVLSRDFEAGLELLADAVVHPIFDDEQFQRVAEQTGRSLIQLHQNPLAAADEQAWTLALPDAPAARPLPGTLESLGRLTRNQVRDFYRSRYRPEGAALAIAGDVTPERAFAVAAEWFGSWRAAEAAPPPAPRAPAPAPKATRIRVVDQPGTSGCALALGLVVPGRDSPDGLARSVAVLTFDEGLGAHLARRVGRDARSSLELTRDFGLWTVQATCPAESAAVLARRLTAEIKHFLAAPPAAAEVAAVKHRIRGAYPLSFETASAIMGQWLLADFAGFPADYFERYGARLAALKPEDLEAALRRGTDAEHPVIVALGNAGRLEPVLKALGPVEVVRFEPPSEFAEAPAESLPPPTAEEERSGRKLVAAALLAHGGRERLSGVTSSIVDASITIHFPGREVTGVLRQLRKDPYKMAYASSLDGVDTRQVLNGKRAWTVFAGSDSVVESDSVEVAALRAGYVSDLPHVLLAAADARARPAARGRDKVAGREADKVEVVSAAGERRVLYFEVASHRLIAMDQLERGPGGMITTRRVYGDFRLVSGIQMPFLEERFVAGAPLMKLDVTRLEVNLQLEEIQFEPPVRPGDLRWR